MLLPWTPWRRSSPLPTWNPHHRSARPLSLPERCCRLTRSCRELSMQLPRLAQSCRKCDGRASSGAQCKEYETERESEEEKASRDDEESALFAHKVTEAEVETKMFASAAQSSEAQL